MSDTTRRRPRRSRSEWQQLIDEQAHSGLTQASFCQTKGLVLSSFQNWKRRLALPSPQESNWLDLGRLGESTTAGWDIELDLGDGLCLRLRRC